MILHEHQSATGEPLTFTRQSWRLYTPGIAEAINLCFDLLNIRPTIQGSGTKAVVATELLRDASEVLGDEYHLCFDVHHRPDRVELHEHELISFESVSTANDMAADTRHFKGRFAFSINGIKDLAAVRCATGAGATMEGSDIG